MGTPTTQEWIDGAMAGEPVWNIGQISPSTARSLDKLVKIGKLAKSRHSFCGISPLKTVWHLPQQEVDDGAYLYAREE